MFSILKRNYIKTTGCLILCSGLFGAYQFYNFTKDELTEKINFFLAPVNEKKKLDEELEHHLNVIII
jgi:hypothetical protein